MPARKHSTAVRPVVTLPLVRCRARGEANHTVLARGDAVLVPVDLQNDFRTAGGPRFDLHLMEHAALKVRRLGRIG